MKVRWDEVVAVYGGTFDPPHLGHRIAVAGLFSQPGVARVLILPSPSPPHKPTLASAEDRLQMARLNFAPQPSVTGGLSPIPGPIEFELCELERAKAHPNQRTYSYDTLMELRRRVPKLAFVIGSDQFAKIHTWHRFPEILGLCPWIVLKRKTSGDDLSPSPAATLSQLEASGLVARDQIQIFDTPAPELSSTQIRETLARSGKPPEGALAPDVITYLMRRGIYGTEKPSFKV